MRYGMYIQPVFLFSRLPPFHSAGEPVSGATIQGTKYDYNLLSPKIRHYPTHYPIGTQLRHYPKYHKPEILLLFLVAWFAIFHETVITQYAIPALSTLERAIDAVLNWIHWWDTNANHASGYSKPISRAQHHAHYAADSIASRFTPYTQAIDKPSIPLQT